MLFLLLSIILIRWLLCPQIVISTSQTGRSTTWRRRGDSPVTTRALTSRNSYQSSSFCQSFSLTWKVSQKCLKSENSVSIKNYLTISILYISLLSLIFLFTILFICPSSMLVIHFFMFRSRHLFLFS